ncbi:MAG TPA: ferrous iron transport protein B [Candidatus Cloacimonadota bacterium]|nr:ferrous iron transport protein B [Candidatus Cloacimonadota bacterium]HPS38700.1 ferrous iron transport protein B [Candidatus Cloacimonadota bacterium]
MSSLHKIALAGNPNVGKTTLFNALTGAHQTVGNWPGVTVEYMSGYYTYRSQKVEVIDLPGIYSLSGGTPDEQVAREYILREKPDLIVNIVDASNLERNLYLSVQLLELNVPMLIVLSMVDIAERNEVGIDYRHLSSHVGCEVFPLELSTRKGVDDLMEAVERNLHQTPNYIDVHYDEVVETAIGKVQSALTIAIPEIQFSRRWTAIKLLEEDKILDLKPDEATRELVLQQQKAISKHRGQPVTAVMADDRFGFIRGLIKDVVKRKRKNPYTFSDRIDQVVLSGIWGMPIFFFVMYLVFLVAVRFSQPLVGLIDSVLSWLLVERSGIILSSLGTPDWLHYILSQGIGGGITTIGTFIPPIFFIYACLSILEDSGYMARAAFISDKFMRRIGLPGKAFIPLLVGFGCTVPAIMATRTLESKRDRIFASLLTPFMSCGAKLPVYTFLGMMFFDKHADLLIFGLYFSGVVMALISGLLLKKTIFRSEPGNFVMELPPYHVPTFNGIFLHTWHRLKDFILRAGKTILLVIICINILQLIYLPSPFASKDGKPEKETVLQIGGKMITPLLYPMGIDKDNWHASVALISGLFAKEAIVGSMQSLYGAENQGKDLRAVIVKHFHSLSAILAFLFFVMLYSPCAAALTMLWREHGPKWTAFTFFYLTLLAWIIATLIYQISHFTLESPLWISLCVILAGSFYAAIRLFGKKETHHV